MKPKYHNVWIIAVTCNNLDSSPKSIWVSETFFVCFCAIVSLAAENVRAERMFARTLSDPFHQLSFSHIFAAKTRGCTMISRLLRLIIWFCFFSSFFCRWLCWVPLCSFSFFVRAFFIALRLKQKRQVAREILLWNFFRRYRTGQRKNSKERVRKATKPR